MTESALQPYLEVEGLGLCFERPDGAIEALREVSLSVQRGECLTLVGESGSGKSVLLKALLRLLPSHARLTSGSVRLQGRELTGLSERDLKALRLKEVGYVFQEPTTAFNPVKRVGETLISRLRRARALSYAKAREETVSLLESLKLRDGASRLDDYPETFSGGELQRLSLALALCVSPALLLLDEITTALDESVALQLLKLIREECISRGVSVLFVTHHLSHAALLADRIAVMYAGRIVECAPAGELLTHPVHPYTQALLKSLPDPKRQGQRLYTLNGLPPLLKDPAPCDLFALRNPEALHIDCLAEPPCYLISPSHEVRSWLCHEAYSGKRYPLKAGEGPVVLPDVPCDFLENMQDLPPRGLRDDGRAAEESAPRKDAPDTPLLSVERLCVRYPHCHEDVLSGISFTLRRGEILALVGESGSGKSTLALSLMSPALRRSGSVRFEGEESAALKGRARRALLRRMQLIFQGAGALNPYLTVFQALSEPMISLKLVRRSELSCKVCSLLELVQLPASLATVRVGELSGGQKERVAIARALSVSPALLIADEPTASLDTTVQASIVNLLLELNRREALSVLFITHDLSLVRHLGHRVALLEKGKLVECAPVAEFFEHPVHPAAKALIASYLEGASALFSSGCSSRRVK